MSKKIIISTVLCFLISIIGLVYVYDHYRTSEKSPSGKLIDSPRQFIPTFPTIEKIFQEDHLWIATLSAEHIRTVVVSGDVVPARSVNYQTVKKNNFSWPFEPITNELQNGDITFVNLESPLIDKCPLTNSGMIFCGDTRHINGLLFTGIDVVSLANNHISNYGQTGIESTIKLLGGVNILAAGVGSPAVKDIRGIRFAFLAYNDVGDSIRMIDEAGEEKISEDISKAKRDSDVIIVAFHWGVEYTDQPTKRQRDLAHLAIDNGADVVLGNHPHWIQPVEIYKNKIISYAHGNLVFDQMWSEKTKEGVIGRYTFYDHQLIDVEFLPIIIYDFGQPRLADTIQTQRIVREMKEGSLKLSGDLSN